MAIDAVLYSALAIAIDRLWNYRPSPKKGLVDGHSSTTSFELMAAQDVQVDLIGLYKIL